MRKLKMKKQTGTTITKKTKMDEALKKNPAAAELLFNAGMHCIGCPMSMSETIEEGCLAHGMSGKEIDELVKKLNKKGNGK